MSEFFSSVWGVLTNSNTLMDVIIGISSAFLEAWILLKIFVMALKINSTKNQILYYVIIISITSLLTKYIIPTPYYIFINYIIMFITTKSLFKLNSPKTFLAILIPVVIFALVGNLILNPILKFFNITAEQLNTIPIYRIIYLVILYGIIYLIIFFLNKINFRLNIANDLDNRSKNLVSLNLIFGIITIFIQLLITFYYINTYPLIFTLLNFISLFAYFFISFYSLNRIMKLHITSKALESAENYNTTLSYLYDNVRAFHHDFDNMLFIIGGFIDNNDIDGLKKYYKNLEKDGERVNEIALLNPKVINNSGIYNLLMSKYKKAHDSNVEIKLEFFFDFNRLQMPIYEFSRILGILLDNGIEAASESSQKHINILFRDSSNNQTQIISIENSYINKDVDTSEIYEKGKTSKKNHTGMGLWEVKQILKRNNNVVLNTTKDEKYFKQTLEIHY